METDSIIISVFLFFAAGFIKIAANMVINLSQKDTGKGKGRKGKMPAFWEMSAEEFKKIAEMEGLP